MQSRHKRYSLSYWKCFPLHHNLYIKDLLLMSYPYYFLVEALKLHFKTAANPSFSYRFIYHADLFLWPPGPVCVPHADLFHLNGQMVGLRLVWYTIMPLCSQSRHFDWYYCDSHVCFCLFFVSTHLHYFKGWVLPQLQLERLQSCIVHSSVNV